MIIPSYLETLIREGNVVLLLGSGASLDACNAAGVHPPNVKQLGDTLSDRFLGGKYKDKTLAQISEYAISVADIRTVQEFIRSIFIDFQPTEAHRVMASFRWWGIATTNYDLLVEKAYDGNKNAAQHPVPFIENGDRVEDRTRDPNSIMLLKLHGCITRTANAQCPLIITPDQYIQYRKNRSRIFDHLTSWAYEKPIVFIGHSLEDSDIRALLLELQEVAEDRPRYYAIAPDVDEIKQRHWDARRISCINGSFADFIAALDRAIPAPFRGIPAPAAAMVHPISKKMVKRHAFSNGCMQFLEADVEFVSAISSVGSLDAIQFYRGHNPGWAAVEQNLDAKRDITDTLLTEHFVAMREKVDVQPQLVLIKAHAGAGKTVLMQRLAWTASRDFDCLCLFLRSNGTIDASAIQEIISTTAERLFLFIDDIGDHAPEVESLFRTIGKDGGRLTIIGAERINEWFFCEHLSPLVTDEYELHYLSTDEIDRLLKLLEDKKSLGTLAPLNMEDRRKAFTERAGRQLLVALHEATLGKPFEEIVADEYHSIQPDRARQIYLSVCVLNRLNVPVRAGVISRIHEIPFTYFQKHFFHPLAQVVFTRFDKWTRDYCYEARHPHIAEIVFEQVLQKAEDRYDAYLRCLGALNIDYKADKVAFSEMVRGRVMLELFPDHQMVCNLYAKAREMTGNAPFLLQQMAIYEMRRPSGNLVVASQLLEDALRQEPMNSTFAHSLAELYLQRADRAKNPLEEAAHLTEAKKLAVDIKRRSGITPYGYHTLIKIAVRRLKKLFASQSSETELEDCIKESEGTIKDALQAFPGDSYILDAESEVAKLLADSERSRKALEKAFALNSRSQYLASRLAAMYRAAGELPKAKEVLQQALHANSGERRLHYEYAKLLMELPESEAPEILYHLQRSFSPGDQNYDARLLYGRELFLFNKPYESRAVFKELGLARVGPEVRNKLNYPLPTSFTGSISRKDPMYCFIRRDASGDEIHAHIRNIESSVWTELNLGVRVSFKIAFSLKGPTAFEVARI